MTTNSTSILTAPMPGTGSKRDLVADFKKGIKQYMSYFPTLKQDKQWDNWNRTMIAQAQAQDVLSILDPQYSTNDPTVIALFQEQQKYMYAVFKRHPQTDKDKALVRAHNSTSNAQLCPPLNQSVFRFRIAPCLHHLCQARRRKMERHHSCFYPTLARPSATLWQSCWNTNLLRG
jgi:hypothetical protein